MTKIDIEHNNITRLRKHAFAGVCRCQGLVIERNKIANVASWMVPRRFEKAMKSKLTQKEQYNLNSETYIPYNYRSFSFILTDNLIQNIDSSMMYGLPVRNVFLDSNPLEVIEDGAFRSNGYLLELNLIDTRLRQIPIGLSLHSYRRGRRSLPSHSFLNELSIHVYKSQAPVLIPCKFGVEKIYYERGYKYYPSSERCQACPLGSYKVGTRDGTCEQCPTGGFYQDEEAMFKILSHGLGCKQCPPGSFVPEEQAPGKDRGECQACPEGTHRNLPALFRACSCLDDHYRVHRFQKCMPCDEGYQCVNETVNLLPGFYWKWSSTDAKYLYTNFSAELQVKNKAYNKKLTAFSLAIPKAYACPVAEACKGGLDSECSPGYEGPLCAVCSKGFYMLASTCRKCPSLPWIIAQVVLIVVIVSGLLIFVIKEKKNKSNKRSLSDAMTARLKIILGFFQVTSGTISGFSYIKWPGVMISVIRYAELLQMNLLQIAPPQCLTRSLKTDIHVKLMLILAFNGAVVLLGLLYYFIKTRLKSKNDEEKEAAKSSAQQQCFRAVFLILFISYPLTSSHIFMVLPEACHKVCTSTDENTCSYYLKSDYTVRCDSQRFFWFSIVARVLLVYPVGFPLLVLYLLWKHFHRKTHPNKREKEALGIALGLKFLYENYAHNVWFWEIIELVRKVLLTSVILLLDPGSRFSIGITAIVSGVYSNSFAYFKPMTDVFEHWLQLTSLLATLVNMFVGILLVTKNGEFTATGGTSDEAVLKVLLIVANAAVVAIMGARYLTTLGQTFLAVRKNPRCSLSCCLFLFLTLNEAGNEMAGMDSATKGLRRQPNATMDMRELQLDLSQAGLSVEMDQPEE